MDINELYLHQFKSFLLKAKLHGYAGGDRLKIRSSDFSKKYLKESIKYLTIKLCCNITSILEN